MLHVEVERENALCSHKAVRTGGKSPVLDPKDLERLGIDDSPFEG